MTFSLQNHPPGTPEPIAIVGAGCWLPGDITSLDGLRDALHEGRDLITEIPTDRWNVDAFYDPDPLTAGKTYVRKGGFVNDIERFDPGFFGISNAEASRMDPQQRMVLQTVWHALENAGQSADELEKSDTGVFLAMMNTNGYAQLKGVYEGLAGITAYDAMGDAMSITAGRIAHFLGVEGPTLALDTACSSSLVALHLARQSILSGESEAAIVVGVNAILHPGIHIAFSKVGLMSRAGHCAAFDASADGYIRGEGCVAVVLRRQSQAIARGDHIFASIVGTAINQDGRTPAMTAPNGRAQEKVIRSALARVGVSPTEVGYVEAHGTGTPVGDPIEMSAIANVFGPGRAPENPLYVGSVKSNFGHIEAGAGLLGLLKAALSLENEEIFPSLHFKQLNPNIDLGPAPVKIPTASVAWPRTNGQRMAGINSFGYSGTNAHVILQEAPAALVGRPAAPKRSDELVVVSAKTEAALEDLVDRWVPFLETDEAPSLADLAFTAATGRTPLNHRLAMVGSTTEDIAARMRTWREGRRAKGLAAGQTRFRIKPKVAFIFTGQGAQYGGMGRNLYNTEAYFAKILDRVAEIMDPVLGAPLKEVLFSAESSTYLSNTRYVQPALFALEYALASFLQHLGIEPDVVIGHSVGEITAACFAGILDLEDAVRFIVARGRLMGALPTGGTMVAIGTDMETARQWIKGREDKVSIATVNGPLAIVISGEAAAVAAVVELAQEAGLRTKALEVSHAFHSPLMDPILDELAEIAATMRVRPGRIPVVSNVTGDFHEHEILPDYWHTHVRQPVMFYAGMEKVIETGATMLVEIGPHPALTPAIATSFDITKLQPIPTLKRDGQDFPNLLGALGLLFVHGTVMNLDRLFWSPHYQRTSLPLYPFRKEKHWLLATGILDRPADAASEVLPELPELHPMLGEVILRTPRQTIFQTSLSTTSPWTDHRVLGTTVFPGTAYLEMAARGFAATQGKAWAAVQLKDVAFERPLLLSYRKVKKVQLTLELGLNGSGEARFTIAAAENGTEIYCQGTISNTASSLKKSANGSNPPEREADMQVGLFYGELRKRGLEYGAKFANVRELWYGDPGSGQAIGRISFSNIDEQGSDDPYANAVLLDGCLHVFGAALRMLEESQYHGAFIPASIRSVTLTQPLTHQVWSQVTMTMNEKGRGAVADIQITNDAGEILTAITALDLRQADSLSAVSPNGSGAQSAGKAFQGLAAKSREELIELLRPMTRRERVRELSKWLTAEITDTLGQAAEGLDLASLPSSTAFLEIGLDSLLVTELQRRIQEKLEFRFKPMQGLDYQSIETMAEYLHDDVLAPDLTVESEVQ